MRHDHDTTASQSTRHARPLGGYRETLHLAYPVALSMLSQTLMWLVDTSFLGRVSLVAQGAAGFAGTCVWLLLSFSVGIGTGVNILVAQSFGAQRRADCGLVTWQGMYISLLIWIPLLVGGLCAPWIVQRLGPSTPLMEPAATYMAIRLFGALPAVLNFSLLGFFRGLGDTRTLFWVTLLTNALNVVLDYLLIFGHAGLPRLEIAGAAGATVLSTAMGSLIYLWLFVRRGQQQGFLMRRLEAFNWAVWWSLVRLSLPIGCQSMLEGGAWAMFTVLVARLGTIEAATHQIALSLVSFAYMLSFGVTIAATTLVGQYLGAANRAAARRSARSCLVLGTVVLSLLGIVLVLGRRPLVGIFTPDPDVIQLGTRLVLWVAAFQIFQGLSQISAGVLRGAGDTRWPMFASIIAGWGVFLPGATLVMFTLQGGLGGGWMSVVGYGLILSLAMLLRLWHGRWQNQILT